GANTDREGNGATRVGVVGAGMACEASQLQEEQRPGPLRSLGDAALLRPRRLCRVEPPVALFNAASPLVPGNGGADMVRAGALACSGDFLLCLAGCEGKDLIAETRRAAFAASRFCGRSPPTPAP